MRWLKRGERKREIEAACEAIYTLELRIANGEVVITVERSDLLPQLYRALLSDQLGIQIGQVMFSWYPNEPPDNAEAASMVGRCLDACASLRAGLSRETTIRYTHPAHIAHGEAMLEFDLHLTPPDLLQLQLVATEPS